MTTPAARMQQALDAFAAIHASDPRQVESAAAPQTHSQRYHDALASWVRRLSASEPSDALLLAAACQHLRRWATPRAGYPAGRTGYKRWRSDLKERHAHEAAEVLRKAGVQEATILRVRALVTKQDLKTDPEMQLFEDAICLSFVECELAAFAANQPADMVSRILDKTLRKMTPRGQALVKEMLARRPG